MRLELTTEELEILFSCEDNNHDHLELLDDIRSLIRKLSSHNNIKLSITSKPLDHYPALPEDDIHPMES